MKSGHERAARSPARGAALALLAALAGCQQPALGDHVHSPALDPTGPQIAITGATVDTTGHVVASLRLTQAGLPVATAEAALALSPRFTLAALSTNPADGLAAWKSLLLTGAQTIPSLPPGGPGTPPSAVVTNVKQPGSEANGTLTGADGDFAYVFSSALPPGFVPAETLRVGVWLQGAGTAEGTSTFDFRPAGGAPAPRDVALYERCRTCHDAVRSHDGAVGVKICTTCHTWQNADPDTADPAAEYPASRSVNPNPLELGRLVHRLHRGKELPTLYARSDAAATGPVTPPPWASAPSLLPFEPLRGGVPPRNTAIVGRKYSIVGSTGKERIFGRVLNDYPADPTLTPRAVPTGGIFPRDLRDCAVCHEGAPQAYEVLYAISRRTCSGCHPEVWFAAAPTTDSAKFPHLGGAQADDTQCGGCHLAATATQPKVYAPIAEIHVPPHRSPRFNRPEVEIVGVDGMKAGTAPAIRFKLRDRDGLIVPSPGAPVPALDAGPNLDGKLASPTPRKMTSISFTLQGPTVPGYWGFPVLSGDVAVPPNPSALTLVADAAGVYTYQFSSKLPADAHGTWAIVVDGRRRYTSGAAAGSPTPLYDAATDTFLWPYTAEIFHSTEGLKNTVVYVDTGTGTWTPDAPGAAVPRRQVVAQEKCERCHDRIKFHGATRDSVEGCLPCHAPFRTDWAQRQAAAGQNIVLGSTFDGLEERSIDMKVMAHRIHTGMHEGSASLEAVEPFVMYGVGKSPFWFGEGNFPNDLRNCTVCHAGQSYRLDVMPADAPPSVANETDTIRHQGTRDHVAGEPELPPIRAACQGCHATSFTPAHAERHTVFGVEQCRSCHQTGPNSVDVAHGLARPDASLVSASFTSIAQGILGPRCASAACHGGSAPAAFPRLDPDAAYDAIVGVDAQQVSGMKLVKPFDPAASYLLVKLRGEAASVGGIATPMPIGDAALDPSDLAAVEAWIANGALND